MATAPSANPPAEQPTHIRFLVVGLCVAMAVLLYLDRYALGPIAGTILAELKIDEEQLGRAIGAFFLVYALFQVPAGWLSDKLGARRTLPLYVAAWSVATICIGLSGGLAAIAAMRMALGIAQAGAYPTAASLLKRWVPLAGRGRANSSVAMGGRAGSLLSPVLTPSLALMVASLTGWQMGSWRLVLVIYGGLGFVWAAAFWWLYRDAPRDHPWCNGSEQQLLDQPTELAETPRSSYGQFIFTMVQSPNVWLLCAFNISVNVGWIFLVTWLPRYLTTRYGTELTAVIDNKEVLAGLLTSLPALGGMIGSIMGGTATDRLVQLYGKRWGRRLPGLCAGFLVCGFYLLAARIDNVWLFVGAMIAISFTIDFGLGASWASAQDIGGRHVASVLGFGNMFGNLAAAFFSWMIGLLAKNGSWQTVLLISGGAMALNACCWLMFDASRPIEREPK